MADNYLEKRMADYRSGRSAARIVTRRGLVFPAVTVFVYGADAAGGDVMLRTLVQAGYKVCFDTGAPAEGAILAQATGARYYPLSPEAIAADMNARGDRLSAVVMLGNDCRESHSCLVPEKWIAVDVAGIDDRVLSIDGQTITTAAVLVAAYAHPDVTL